MSYPLNNAIINAGCLMFFNEPAATSRQTDVLDSLLYVQLAASKRHAKFTEFEHWKDTWLAASSRFGWTLQRSEHISEPAARGISQTVWGIGARALLGFVGETRVAEAEHLVRQPPQPQALDLLVSQTSQLRADRDKPSETTLVFQIGIVDAPGNLTLLMLHFTTRQPLGRDVLFASLDAASLSGNIELTVCSMRLADLVYRQFREPFATALQDRRAALIRPWKEASHAEQP